MLTCALGVTILAAIVFGIFKLNQKAEEIHALNMASPAHLEAANARVRAADSLAAAARLDATEARKDLRFVVERLCQSNAELTKRSNSPTPAAFVPRVVAVDPMDRAIAAAEKAFVDAENAPGLRPGEEVDETYITSAVRV